MRSSELQEFKNITWDISTPLPEKIMEWSPTEKKLVPIDPIKLQKPVLPSTNYQVVILWDSTPNSRNCIPVVAEPVVGTTVYDVLKTIDKGMRKSIKPVNRQTPVEDEYFSKVHKKLGISKNTWIYRSISNYIDANKRIRRIKNYERGILKPYELLGDHVFFEGIMKKGKKLLIHLGS